MAITENHIRLIRQYLYAKEQGRNADAAKIWDYLTKDEGLNLEETTDFTLGMIQRWGIPASVDRVVILVSYGREPIWRMPANKDTREAGIYEMPLEIPDKLKSLRKYFTLDDN